MLNPQNMKEKMFYLFKRERGRETERKKERGER
jgi:hypothetical protein